VALVTTAGFSWLFVLPIQFRGHTINLYIAIKFKSPNRLEFKSLLHSLGASHDTTAIKLKLFDGQELSCWERHLLQPDSARLAA
jgi:hypothetical protein